MVFFLGGMMVWLIFDTKHLPVFPAEGDTLIRYTILPLVSALLLLFITLQPCKSIIKTFLLESELFVMIGNLSFAIYLFHAAIGLYYFRMAVEGWTSILPPPTVTSYELLYQAGWLQHYGLFFKITVSLICISVSYVLQHFLVDKYLLPFAARVVGCCCGGSRRSKEEEMIMMRSRSDSFNSLTDLDQHTHAATTMRKRSSGSHHNNT